MNKILEMRQHISLDSQGFFLQNVLFSKIYSGGDMKIPAGLLQDLSTSIFTDNFQDHVIKLQ